MYTRIYVEITNICNMSCSFCHGHKRQPRMMTVDEFSLVLDRLKGHTEYIYYHLMGEPLTHPELPQLLNRAAEKGFCSVITTNGTLLKRHKGTLITAGVHKVSVSLHSFEQGDDDAFERYLNEVADFADAASGAGIIVVLRLWNRGCDDGRNERVLDFLRNRLDGDWADNTKGIRIRNKLYLEWGDRFEWPDSSAAVQGSSFYCYGLKDHFGILCDGTVVPCCLDSDGVIALGNIFDENIDDILASERARAMVKGFECRTASEELCRRCGYAQRFV